MANHIEGGDGSDRTTRGDQGAGKSEHLNPERAVTRDDVKAAKAANPDIMDSATGLIALDRGLQTSDVVAQQQAFDSFGIDMGDGTIRTARGVEQKGDGPRVYERPAKQAVEPMPSPSSALDEAPYDSSVTLNVQITNVPDVPDPVNVEDLGQYASTVLEAGAQAVRPIEQWLATPKAVNDALASIGPALDTAVTYYANTPADQVLRDVQSLLGAATQALEDTISHPMTPDERAEMAGTILPMFFFEGNLKEPINPKTVEQMGLESLSEAELKALGIESRSLRMVLERDEFSIQAKIPGDDRAWFRAEMPEPGVVCATDLFRGNLPEGMGNIFFAEAMEAHGALPTRQLILSGIRNAESVAQFKAGVAAEETLVGKCATKALKRLGITPNAYRYEVKGNHLNIVIDTQG